MQNLSYEMFVRNAFSYALKEDIERCEDPAKLANTDAFNTDNIDSVKSAIGYCMNIYNKDILERLNDDVENGRIEDFVKKIIGANTLSDISTILDDYETTVKNKYFTHANGIIKLK